MTMWNTANARMRSWPSSVDCSTPMPDASVHAADAPKTAAPTNASQMTGARLNKPTMTPSGQYTDLRRTQPVDVAEALQQARVPPTAPTPNSAMSTPNSALLACRTLRTNSMPSENSAPSPSATATVAGITARTSGMRNASRNRTGGSAVWSTAAVPSHGRADAAER